MFPTNDSPDGDTQFGSLMAVKSDPAEVLRAKAMRETADTFAIAQMSAQVALMLAEAYNRLAVGEPPASDALLATREQLLTQIAKFSKLA